MTSSLPVTKPVHAGKNVSVMWVKVNLCKLTAAAAGMMALTSLWEELLLMKLHMGVWSLQLFKAWLLNKSYGTAAHMCPK